MSYIYTVNVAYINNDMEHKEVECLLCFHLQGAVASELALAASQSILLEVKQTCCLLSCNVVHYHYWPLVCMFMTICVHRCVY